MLKNTIYMLIRFNPIKKIRVEFKIQQKVIMDIMQCMIEINSVYIFTPVKTTQSSNPNVHTES